MLDLAKKLTACGSCSYLVIIYEMVEKDDLVTSASVDRAEATLLLRKCFAASGCVGLVLALSEQYNIQCYYALNSYIWCHNFEVPLLGLPRRNRSYINPLLNSYISRSIAKSICRRAAF